MATRTSFKVSSKIASEQRRLSSNEEMGQSELPLALSMTSQRVYEVRPRQGIDVALISFPMRCHSVGSGTPSRLTLSGMPSFAVAHMMPGIRVYGDAGNVIETHEQMGDFVEP